MKKFLSVLLGAVCMLSLAGCGESKKEETEEKEEEVMYEDVVKSPECPSVDETGYTVYYFDGEGGNDANDGLSQTTAKKSLSALNALAAGVTQPTKFLMKKGSTFRGNLTLRGYVSTKEQPLLIGSYGDEGYPLIVGEGDSAVTVYGENVRLSGLEVTNPKGYRGIHIEAIKNGANENIVVDGCYVHDVRWKWEFDEPVEEAAERIGDYDVTQVCSDAAFLRSYSTSGIYFFAGSYKEGTEALAPRWFRNIFITNNKVTTVGRCGIVTNSEWTTGNGCQWGGKNKYRSQDDGWYPPEYVVIARNDISYVGGDGIVPIGVQDCWIEYNRCYHAGLLGRAPDASAAIWPVNCRRVYIQFNEAAYTHLDHGNTDGEGFDIDIGSSDVIFQYNYSHDNAGGGLLICNAHAQMPVLDDNGNPTGQTFDDRGNWNNVRIRNNVFVNNGKGNNNAAFLVMSSDCKNIICENNFVSVNSELLNQTVISSADYAECGSQENLVLRNNIFYSELLQYNTISLSCCRSYVCQNNLYWNFPDLFFNKWQGIVDENPIRDVNPDITIPAERDGYSKITAYRPSEGSVFTRGMKLERMSKLDAAGKSAQNKSYLGAFCE